MNNLYRMKMADGRWDAGLMEDRQNMFECPTQTRDWNRIADSVTDEEALFVGDVLATGFWAAKTSEIGHQDTVVILGGGPTGICTLLCDAENAENHYFMRGGSRSDCVCKRTLPGCAGGKSPRSGRRELCERA